MWINDLKIATTVLSNSFCRNWMNNTWKPMVMFQKQPYQGIQSPWVFCYIVPLISFIKTLSIMLCCALSGQWAVQGFVLPNKCSNKVVELVMKNILGIGNWVQTKLWGAMCPTPSWVTPKDILVLSWRRCIDDSPITDCTENRKVSIQFSSTSNYFMDRFLLFSL